FTALSQSLPTSPVSPNPPTHRPIYPLSLHDALPISVVPDTHARSGDQLELRDAPVASAVERDRLVSTGRKCVRVVVPRQREPRPDRKSTRLNSSHVKTSYAVFCLKKNRHGIGRHSLD